MKKIPLREWIRRNRAEIDKAILGRVPNIGDRLNDDERRLWVLNDEGLYLWARGDGARVD